jgi:hypothetical protein
LKEQEAGQRKRGRVAHAWRPFFRDAFYTIRVVGNTVFSIRFIGSFPAVAMDSDEGPSTSELRANLYERPHDTSSLLALMRMRAGLREAGTLHLRHTRSAESVPVFAWMQNTLSGLQELRSSGEPDDGCATHVPRSTQECDAVAIIREHWPAFRERCALEETVTTRLRICASSRFVSAKCPRGSASTVHGERVNVNIEP